MKKLYSYLFMALAAFSTILITAMEEQKGAKSITRIVNNSNEITVSIVPYSSELGPNLEKDDAYVITQMTTWEQPFDVPLANPIVIDEHGDSSKLEIFAGGKSQYIDVDNLKGGAHAVVIDAKGTISLTPISEAGPAQIGLATLDPKAFEGPVEKPEEGERNTYISKIVNKSEAKVLHILPFRELLLAPTGTQGYTLRSKDWWKANTDLEERLFVGSDTENSGILIVAEHEGKKASMMITPQEFKQLSENNTLTISQDGTIELSPQE